MKKPPTVITFIVILLTIHSSCYSQKINTSSGRVKTGFTTNLAYIGSVRAKNAAEIESSNWMIGCETLDRDFADYEQYKEYLAPLGIKLIRLQAGWAKTEKVKGEYDWFWLDKIINDAVSRGLKPWLQTSYGNTLYQGGGGANLGAGIPVSGEALAAYDRWVEAMVTRYKDKVKDWEVWNEPNFGDNTVNTPEMTADLNIRTAEIIKRVQPDSRISGLALGHIGLEFAERFFRIIADKGKMGLFDNMTYHDYCYNPDGNYAHVEAFRAALHKYAPGMKIRQGENGAPSEGGSGGALWDYNWSELTQAKWDTRRMLGNLGHDIECSIFSIIDMAYTTGPIHRLNHKGIIKSDSSKRAVRPKLAYYAIQNVTSVFDNTLSRLEGPELTYNLQASSRQKHRYTKSTDRSLAVYGYEHTITKKQVFTIWMDEGIPTDSNKTKEITLSFSEGNFDHPVFVDVLTGGVYEIPAGNWTREGKIFTFKDIPVYDSPVLIADRSLVSIR